MSVFIDNSSTKTINAFQRVLCHFGWYHKIMDDYATSTIPQPIHTKKHKIHSPPIIILVLMLSKSSWLHPCLIPPQWDVTFHVSYDVYVVDVSTICANPIGPTSKITLLFLLVVKWCWHWKIILPRSENALVWYFTNTLYKVKNKLYGTSIMFDI
jgi:hypothetical protein